jgi:2-C-methyl-D-erythritol 4-phosphate cytidylyltransferase
VIAAAPLAETLKRGREPGPTIERTESRDDLWLAQTPQVFRAPALRQAVDVAPERLAGATDDATLVEEAGGRVLIEPATQANLKVTTAADLRLAELILGARQ